MQRSLADTPRAVTPATIVASTDPIARLALVAVAAAAFFLPWEISKTLFPLLRTEIVGTESVSIIDLARVSMAISLLALPWAVHTIRREQVWVALGGVAAVFVLGALNALDTHGAVVELCRLGVNLGFCVVAAGVAAGGGASTVIRWFQFSMLAASGVMVAQQVTGTYLWNVSLAVAGSRSNGPFADPNIAGRFIAVALLLEIGGAISSQRLSSRRDRKVRLARLGVLVAGLAATGSRGAVLAFVVGAILLGINRTRSARRLSAGLAMSTVILLGLGAFALRSVRDRLFSLTSGLDAIGSRRSLINAAWQMWLDHPIRGVGLASYDDAILGPYSAYQGYFGAAQSLSHTAFMTTLAELGVFGLAAFVVFAITVLGAIPRSRGVTMEATFAISLAVVFVSAQAEGRFWEDPLTWLLFGLLVGVARRRRLDAR